MSYRLCPNGLARSIVWTRGRLSIPFIDIHPASPATTACLGHIGKSQPLGGHSPSTGTIGLIQHGDMEAFERPSASMRRSDISPLQCTADPIALCALAQHTVAGALHCGRYVRRIVMRDAGMNANAAPTAPEQAPAGVQEVVNASTAELVSRGLPVWGRYPSSGRSMSPRMHVYMRAAVRCCLASHKILHATSSVSGLFPIPVLSHQLRLASPTP